MKVLFARRDFLDVADGINAFLYAVIEPLLEQGDEIHLVGPTPVAWRKFKSVFPAEGIPFFIIYQNPAPLVGGATLCLGPDLGPVS